MHANAVPKTRTRRSYRLVVKGFFGTTSERCGFVAA
jgi:hypothetical protein